MMGRQGSCKEWCPGACTWQSTGNRDDPPLECGCSSAKIATSPEGRRERSRGHEVGKGNVVGFHTR